MQNVMRSGIRSFSPRDCSSVRVGLGLLATSCTLLLLASPKTLTTIEPACPAWNEDEWNSFGALLSRADDETEPAILATGSLLAYCFPEAFEIVP